VVVNAAQFKASVSAAAPPPQGSWDQAHKIVQDEESSEAAWVHAYLHRIEGDLGNATYWYRRAGKSVANGSLEAEWEAIASTLLGSGRA
jgi:hypothetical protein